MKKLIFFVLIIVIFYSCEESESLPIDYDKIELDTFIINNFKKDAKQLYFHEIFNNENHSQYYNPIIDTNEVYKILKIIQAVYNSNSPHRDTVFNFYSIHNRYCYSFSSIGLKVQTDSQEIENMVNGIIPTGNSQLDNILTTYHFDSVRTVYSYPSFPWLTIYTPDEYNMIPIEKGFNEISSIILAEMNNGCIGDGNNISLDRNGDSAIITFSIGSGDCPAGCIYHRYWEFKIVSDYAVFIRAYDN